MPEKSFMRRALFLILAVSILAAVWWFSIGRAQHLRRVDIARAKVWIEAQLKDPLSAQYRNVRAVPDKNGYPREVICGEVNAKNSLGGYVGFRRFYWHDPANPENVVLFQQIESENNSLFVSENYELFCGR